MFKGLDADTVIMLDIDKRLLEDGYKGILYVGSSRARIRLILMSAMNNNDCVEIIKQLNLRKKRKPQKEVATLLDAKLYEL